MEEANDTALAELRSVESELKLKMKAVEDALKEVQRMLEPLKEWRASELWETMENALDVLTQGEFTAWCYPHKPKDFRHWREKYVIDPSACPF
jgi:hypothetical protein